MRAGCEGRGAAVGDRGRRGGEAAPFAPGPSGRGGARGGWTCAGTWTRRRLAALIAGPVAQQTFAAGQALVPDALVAGPGAAARALVGRTSFLLVVAARPGR